MSMDYLRTIIPKPSYRSRKTKTKIFRLDVQIYNQDEEHTHRTMPAAENAKNLTFVITLAHLVFELVFSLWEKDDRV